MRLAIVIVLALSAPAFAQKPDASAAFDRGKKLMADGKTAEACAEFEASMRFEAANGTLYNLALCHEKLGKLATAWTEFKELAANDSNAARAKDANKHAAALEPRLTRMRLVAPATPGLVVERDGKDVTTLVGSDEPVDPGKYTFKATAPGYEPREVVANVSGEGKTAKVEIPALSVTSGPQPITQDEYSTRLPLRPLVLPSGMAQLEALTNVQTGGKLMQAPIDLGFGMAYGLGKVELAASIDFHGRYAETTNKPSQPASVYAAGYYALTPMFALGLEYSDYEPRGTPRETTGSDYRATGARKYLVANNVALVARAGVEYVGFDAPCYHPTAFSAFGDGRAQFAATEQLSFEAEALLALHLDGNLYKDNVGLVLAGRGQYAIRHQLDVFALAQFPVQPTTDPSAYIIGVDWRTR